MQLLNNCLSTAAHLVCHFCRLQPLLTHTIAPRYNIDGLPTCVLFKNGQPVHRIVGMATSAQVKIELAPFLD